MKTRNNEDVFQRVVQLRQEGGEAVLATVIKVKGSTPRKQGARMLVYGDGSICGTVGGGIREADIIKMARELLTSDQETSLITVDFSEGLKGKSGPVCGGEMEIFLERIGGKRALILGGAGHVSLCLYNFAIQLDYRVVVIDPREEFNNIERFPMATRIVREFDQGVEGITITPNDAIVLVGPSHDCDQRMLPGVLESSAGYVGMIGSKRKRKEVYTAIKKKYGFTDQQLERIYSPIGLEIGSESPAEIAVSVIAEIIKHFKMDQKEQS